MVRFLFIKHAIWFVGVISSQAAAFMPANLLLPAKFFYLSVFLVLLLTTSISKASPLRILSVKSIELSNTLHQINPHETKKKNVVFALLPLFPPFDFIKHLLGECPNKRTRENAYELAICVPKVFELIVNTLG